MPMARFLLSHFLLTTTLPQHPINSHFDELQKKDKEKIFSNALKVQFRLHIKVKGYMFLHVIVVS